MPQSSTSSWHSDGPDARPIRTALSPLAWSIYLAWTVIAVDGSALNLALPAIAHDLRADPAGITWTVDAYTLPLAAFLLLGGNLGDRFGTVRIFRIGIIGFAASTIACALTPSLSLLLAARGAQGLFAALLTPMLLAMTTDGFSDQRERSRTVNLMTLTAGAGLAIGPFVGGLLTDSLGWRAVFWMTVPLALTAALLLPATLGKGRAVTRIGWLDQVLGASGLFILVSGLLELGRQSSVRGPVLLIVAGTITLIIFILVQRRSQRPMLPLWVFRNQQFRRTILGGFAFQISAYGLPFFLALHLQRHWGLSAATGGLLLAPFAAGVVLASVAVNPWLQHKGLNFMTNVGAVLGVVGAGILAPAVPGSTWLVLIGTLCSGLGTGIYSTALNKSASSALGPAIPGLASGIYNTFRQVGQCVGIAVFGILAFNPQAQTMYLVALGVVAVCSTAVILSAGRAVTPSRIHRSAESQRISTN